MTFDYEQWIPLTTFLGGLAAAMVGWFARGHRIGWTLLVGGFVACIGFAPSLWLTKVVVSDDMIRVRNGIWGMTANADLLFDDIRGVRITSEQLRGSRGRKRTTYYLNFECVAGEDVKLPVANGVIKSGMTEIVKRLRDRGIAVNDLTTDVF